MLSNSKMQTAGQSKKYYTEENYYQKNSEVGKFYSSSNDFLKVLGLEQGCNVEKDLHYKLVDGFNPSNDEALANNSGKKGRRAGMDFTTTAPKSVSILYEYGLATKDESLVALLKSIQTEANLLMMNEASKYARTRLSGDDRVRVKADMLWASFDHEVARASKDGSIDPSLHTHNYIYNLVMFNERQEDGSYIQKIQSLENAQMLNMKKYLGQYYRNELARLLNENGLQTELTDAKNGFFELKGFDREKHILPFSKRSVEIREDAQKMIDEGKFHASANLQKVIEVMRKIKYTAKKELDRVAVLKDNLLRMAEVGINNDFVNDIFNGAKEEKKQLTHNDKMTFLKRSYEALSEMYSVFRLEDLKTEFMKQTVGFGISGVEVESLIRLDKEIVRLDVNSFTTRTVLDAETYVIQQLHNKNFIVDENLTRIDAFLKNNEIELTNGQKSAVDMIVRSEEQFLGIQGDAGSGKTFALKVIKGVYGDEFDFVGLAPTGQASDNLQKDSDIHSKTIDSYLISEPKRNGKKRIILLDESGMVDSVKLCKLIKKAVENGDKLVLIGDTKQFLSVGAGKIFKDIQDYGIKLVNVTENKRQETAELRSAVDNIKEKRIKEAFEDLKDSLVKVKQINLLDKLIEDYTPDAVVLSSTNKEKIALNLRIREKIIKEYPKNLNLNESFDIQQFRDSKPSGVAKYHTQSYEIGQIIIVEKEIKGLKQGQRLKVVGFDGDNNLILDGIPKEGNKRDRTKKGIIFDLGANIDKVSVFTPNETPNNFAVGERIMFSKNITSMENKVYFKNGTMAFIKSVNEDGTVTVTTDSKTEVTFDPKKYPFFDYGYAITNYKSQGMSIKKVLVSANTLKASLNSFYVELTRAKVSIKIYTSNITKLMERVKQEQIKNSTNDFTNAREFEEQEKTIVNNQKKDLIEAIKKEVTEIKKNIKENNYGKSNNGNVKQNDGKNGIIGATKLSINAINDRAREAIGEFIRTVSSSIRRGEFRRKSFVSQIRRNFVKFKHNPHLCEATKQLDDMKFVNRFNKNVKPIDVLNKLNLQNGNLEILPNRNKHGFYQIKDIQTDKVYTNFELYSQYLKQEFKKSYKSMMKDFKEQIENEYKTLSNKKEIEITIIKDEVVKKAKEQKEFKTLTPKPVPPVVASSTAESSSTTKLNKLVEEYENRPTTQAEKLEKQKEEIKKIEKTSHRKKQFQK